MKYYKYTYKKYAMLIVTIIAFILCFLLPVDVITSIHNLKVEFIILFFVMIFHEILHGIGFKITGAKSKNIVYGVKIEEGIFYCACKEEISKFSIMISLIFPIIFLTIIPFAIGYFYYVNYLYLIAFINLIGSSFDLFVFIDFIKLPKNLKYKDLDDTLGFILISKENLNKYKYSILKIIESNDYNSSKIKAADYRKIYISNFSKNILIVLIILLLISFML